MNSNGGASAGWLLDSRHPGAGVAKRAARVRSGLATVLGMLLLLLCSSPASAKTLRTAAPRDAGSQVQQCASLLSTDFSSIPGAPTQFIAARVVPAQPPTPAYCDATGVIASRIHFVIDLPLDNWNRDYVQVGNGGFGGTIPTEGSPPTDYLDQGAAVASDDTGHIGSPVDATFAAGDNRQAQIDWGYLSEHLLVVAAQSILPHFYGKQLSHKFFIGCSTGGRQALKESQKYPKDFAGIVAGDPANYQNLLAPLEQGYRELTNRDANRNLILGPTDATAVENAVLAYCTKKGDAVNGIITDPRLCNFPIQSLECTATNTSNCLSAAQVGVLAKWYDVPRNTKGQPLYPDDAPLPLGSEGGWVPYDIISDANFSLGGMFADQVLKFLAFPHSPGPTYSLYDFDYNQGAAKLLEMAKIYNADNPDLSSYEQAGGKLILYHGFSDPLISPYGSIDYYEHAIAETGGIAATQKFFRFFLMPGMYHCSGGPGPDTVNWYTEIRNWVQNGTAPDKVLAQKVSNGSATMTRPLYPYPMEAKYLSGDPTKETSYGPTQGPRGSGTEVDFGSLAPPVKARPPKPGPKPRSCVAASGRLVGLSVGPLRLLMTRRRARTVLKRYATRGRASMDFFCLWPVGIRAGYASARLMNSVPRTRRAGLQGRVVLLLSSNRRYALRGVRSGTSLRTARRRLKLGRAIRLGANQWFFAAAGRAMGVLKVAGGTVQEVGLADRALTRDRRAQLNFLESF